MGGGTYDPGAYRSFTSRTASMPAAAVFKSRGMKDSMNPLGVVVRESRDSVDNPNSTPCIIGFDVTGSMGSIPDAFVRKGLGVLFESIFSRKPITDPHVMVMAIGDATCDKAPLQVSQFEADMRVVEQLTDIYLEGEGGGNGFESYNLPWYFAANHTSTDSFEKRGKKGFLFTMGDENFPDDLTPEQIKRVCGDDVLAGSLKSSDLLAAAERMYHVFHIIIEEGSHCRDYDGSGKALKRVQTMWRENMGEHRVLSLSDHTKLGELIVSTMQIVEGADPAAVASSWSGDTSLVVAAATVGVVAGKAGGAAAGVRRF